MRRNIVDNIVRVLVDSGKFKKVYKNILPNIEKIAVFPTAAVVYEREKVMREFISGKTMRYEADIIIPIVNKHKNSNLDDVLTDLIDIIQDGILSDKWIVCNTVDCWVEETERDGGTLYPLAIAQVVVKVRYIYKIK